MVSRCGSFAWRHFESRVRQGANVRLFGAPGAAASRAARDAIAVRSWPRVYVASEKKRCVD